MKKRLELFFCIILSILIYSCAGQKVMEKKLETEIKATPITKQEDIIETAREYIANSNNLSVDQKTKLNAIQEKAIIDTNTLKEEINKSRMILIKSAFLPKYNAREVEILKRKILALERKKIRIGLNAFTEARNVIDPSQLPESKSINKVFLHDSYSPF
jgi:hypothetical protein